MVAESKKVCKRPAVRGLRDRRQDTLTATRLHSPATTSALRFRIPSLCLLAI